MFVFVGFFRVVGVCCLTFVFLYLFDGFLCLFVCLSVLFFVLFAFVVFVFSCLLPVKLKLGRSGKHSLDRFEAKNRVK